MGKVQEGNAGRRLGRTKEKNEKVTARQERKNEKYTVVQTQAGPTYCFLAAGAPSRPFVRRSIYILVFSLKFDSTIVRSRKIDNYATNGQCGILLWA